jgi:hypothetical protein
VGKARHRAVVRHSSGGAAQRADDRDKLALQGSEVFACSAGWGVAQAFQREQPLGQGLARQAAFQTQNILNAINGIKSVQIGKRHMRGKIFLISQRIDIFNDGFK